MAMPSIALDPVRERVHPVRRTGDEGWADNWLEQGADVPVPSLGAVLPHLEIFALD